MTARLGLLFLRGSGRRGVARLLLLIGGVTLGVWCLLAALAFPTVLAARQDRAAARIPISATDSHGRGMYRFTEIRVGGRVATVVLLATEGAAPAPPGLTKSPEPGHAAVSPALRRLLDEYPTAQVTFPHRVTAHIAAQGLVSPDELYAYVGVPAAALRDVGLPLGSFGAPYQPDAELSRDDLRLVHLAVGLLVGLPLLVYFTVCARLSAENRDRRLSALRLVGMSARATRRVAAFEAVVASAAGSIVGIGAYEATRDMIANSGIGGLAWFSSDARPSSIALVASLVGPPLAASLVSVAGSRRAVSDALAVRRQARSSSGNLWRLLPFGVGVSMLLGILVPSYAGGVGAGPFSPLLMLIAVTLTGMGLALGFGPLASAVARTAAARTQRPSLWLGMRRLVFEPAAATRVVAGLVIAVFAFGCASGILRDARAAASPAGTFIAHRADADELPPGALAKFSRLPGVGAMGLVARSNTVPLPDAPAASPATPGVAGGAAPMEWPVTFLFATCDDLRVLVEAPLPGCVDGRGYVLAPEDVPSTNPSLRPGHAVRLLRPHPHGSAGPHPHDETHTVSMDIPAEALTLPADAVPLVTADVLLPPSELPHGEVPAATDVVLASAADAAAIDEVSSGIARILPGVAFTVLDGDPDARRRAEILRAVLIAALWLGLLVGMLAFMVGVLDRAIERRANIAALHVVGVPIRMLRASQAVGVALPLGVGVVLAVIASELAQQTILVVGGFVQDWSWKEPGIALLVGLGVTGSAALATIAAVPRRIDVSLVRRE